MDSSSHSASSTPSSPLSQAALRDLLKQGLAAIAAQDDPRAIALLTAVLEDSPPSDLAERASVGLVKVHQRQGNLAQAIAYCQPLVNSSRERTRQWSRRALAALQPQKSHSEFSHTLGPGPITETAQPPVLPSTPAAPDGATGFVRLGEPVSQPPPPPSSAPAPPPIGPDSRTPSQAAPTSPTKVEPSPSKSTRSEPAQRRPARPAHPFPWRRAAPAQRWNPVAPARWHEIAAVALSAIASLVILSSGLLQWMMAIGNPIRRFITRFVYVERWRFLEEQPTLVVISLLIALWGLSPWILQLILRRWGATPLPPARIGRVSPKAMALIESQNYKPRLLALPIRAPLVFSYGLHPRLSWLVVSDGVYQLDPDQIAALVAAELSQIASPVTACLTLTVAVAQLFYGAYCGIATWGNRQSGLLRGVAAAIASLAYGLFWLFRWPSLGMARWRHHQGDRLGVSKTGDPNAHARALITLSAAIATARRRDPALGVWLEGFAPLFPVSPEAALPFSALLQRSLTEPEFFALLNQRLLWPCPSRYRPWLTLNQTHPPLTQRLQGLMAIAQRWGLPLELPNHRDGGGPAHINSSAGTSRDMLLQTAPYWAPLLGAGLALLLWAVGGIAGRQSVLGWLWGDRSILYGLVAMGLSMGLLARVNRYFPDLKVNPEPAASDWVGLHHYQGIPVQATPITLSGRLLGRSGLLNALSQDLLLDTEAGLVRIRYCSALGPVGNLFLGQSPYRMLGQRVTVTGWFRRGATAWIDASQIRAGRISSAANPPLWVTLLGLGLALWGAWTMYRGV